MRGVFSLSLLPACLPVRPSRSATDRVLELTAIITPATTQPVAALGIHDRSARLAHARRCRRGTRGEGRRRPVRRAVAESELAGGDAAVEVLALDGVLGAAVPVGTAAAVVVPWDVGSGRHAGAGAGDAADGVAADVDLEGGGLLACCGFLGELGFDGRTLGIEET